MKRAALLLVILATPVLAKAQVISQTRFLTNDQNQRTNIPVSEQPVPRSMAVLSSARAASIEAARAWYKWDKGAATEQEIELERLRELTKKWQAMTAPDQERR